MDRARQELPLPRPPAIEQRGDDGHGELLTGDVKGVPHLGRDRRQIVLAAGGRIVAAIHHDAPQREVHQVRALEVGPGAMVAEGGRPRDDQRGILRHQRARSHPEPVELSPGRGLQEHIGGGDERAKPLAVFMLAQIEHDRALPAVVLPEEQGALGIFPVLVEGTDTARGAAAGGSTLTTSAPRPASVSPQYSACSSASSMTRMPVSGPGLGVRLSATERSSSPCMASVHLLFPVMISGDYRAMTRPAEVYRRCAIRSSRARGIRHLRDTCHKMTAPIEAP